MENQPQTNLNNEKVLTLKSLEKEVNLKFKEYDEKLKVLERKIEVVKQAVRANYGK